MHFISWYTVRKGGVMRERSVRQSGRMDGLNQLDHRFRDNFILPCPGVLMFSAAAWRDRDGIESQAVR
jgi:hypothetical protein